MISIILLWGLFISVSGFALEQPKSVYDAAKTNELIKLLEHCHCRFIPDQVGPALQLIRDGADPNTYATTGMRSGWTWLLFMINNRQYDVVSNLLDLGADPNKPRNTDKMSPLSMACINNPDSSIVQILIAKGAQVNARDTRGRCPLWECTNLTCAQLLLENGAAVGMIQADRFKQDVTALARLQKKDDVVALMESYKKQKML